MYRTIYTDTNNVSVQTSASDPPCSSGGHTWEQEQCSLADDLLCHAPAWPRPLQEEEEHSDDLQDTDKRDTAASGSRGHQDDWGFDLLELGGLQCRPGERGDNAWLQHRPAPAPGDQLRLVSKPYLGFYTWPTEPMVYAAASLQPPLDRGEDTMPEAERIVHTFFNDDKNVSKFVDFLSMENRKGWDYFDVERFGMFKALFRNFGDSFLERFRPHIERLVRDPRESHQRAAVELLAGVIRGAKHWGEDKVQL